MHLIIDQGNTYTKYAVVGADEVPLFKTQTEELENSVLEHIKNSYAIKNCLLCSVKNSETDLERMVTNTLPDAGVLVFDTTTPLPVKNLYSTPETLGRDRIAGVCGAARLFPGKNCLVIDAGSCITYDFIDGEKNYHGGSISPGLAMRLKAMHHFTGRLPHAPLEWVEDFTGHSTLTSLQTGVIYGVLGEIDGLINRYTLRWGQVTPVLCGGDTEFLANRPESKIFAAPDLVITGLNEILIYNLPHAA